MKRQKAIVVGGGFVGLVAARVLSDHFESVVILEKDPRIGSDIARMGAPQGAHLHVLLKRGQEILKELFPGIDTRFIEEQCPLIDWSADTAWETHLGTFPRYQSEMTTYALSRPFLESTVYSLVSQRTNVSFQLAHIEEIIMENEMATSVRCEDGGVLEANLVVLAGGQHFPLKRLMFPLLIEEQTESLPIQITYRSVVFKTDSLSLKDFKQYYYQFSPPQDSLGAVISPTERGRCIATIIEHARTDQLKTDFPGYMKLAGKVPNGRFAQILGKAIPLSEVSVFHKPTMYLRRLHKVKNFPKNVFGMGDVFCSLNPVFGQGMTMGLEQALILQKHLQGRKLSACDFHRRSARKAQLPFLLSKLGSNIEDGFSRRYLQNYMLRCQRSQGLHGKFLKVLHLQASYGALLDPYAFFVSIFKRRTQ